MFFKKGLRKPSLIWKLAMKNPMMSEEMFYIANRYALAEEATRISQAHPRATTRWEKWTILSTRWNDLVAIRSIFHPQGKHKIRDCHWLQGFVDEVLKTAKAVNQEKKPEDSKNDFPEASKEVNYIFGSPDSYEPKWNEKLTTWEVMAIQGPHYFQPRWPPELYNKARAVNLGSMPHHKGC
jgi:hypothetical protein